MQREGEPPPVLRDRLPFFATVHRSFSLTAANQVGIIKYMAEAKEKTTPLISEMGSSDRDRDLDLSAIAEMFEWRTPTAVHEFLVAQPQVRQFLHTVPRQVERFFGKTRLILDVCEDPGESSPPDLFVYIVTCLSPPEAWKRMNEIDEQWLDEAEKDCPVHLNVEFA